MPELPEVQTVINHLQPLLVGKTIQNIYNPNGYNRVLDNGNLTDYSLYLNKTNFKKFPTLSALSPLPFV